MKSRSAGKDDFLHPIPIPFQHAHRPRLQRRALREAAEPLYKELAHPLLTRPRILRRLDLLKSLLPPVQRLVCVFEQIAMQHQRLRPVGEFDGEDGGTVVSGVKR